MTEALLRVDGLSKGFGGLRAVDGVDLVVAGGERRAVIGPNGAGKTTLFHLITGLLRADGGSIVFQGRRIDRLGAPQRVRLGLGRSFQITSIFPGLSALENVQVALFASRGHARRLFRAAARVADDAARAMLGEVGLEEKARTPAGELSYGDQRRLELALAIALEPQMLVLDEPAAGVAEAERRQIMELLLDLCARRRLTLLFTDHDMDVVFGIADRVTVMHQGRVLAEGTPDAVRRNEDVVRVYLG